MLDADLAEIYGVQTKVLNQAVKRNKERFPAQFMFRLTREEVEELNRSQFVTGSQKHRDPRYPPYAFTEHGALMLASVLKSATAVQTSIQIVSAFVSMRAMLAAHAELADKLAGLEKKVGKHAVLIATLLEKLMAPPEGPKRRPIGFRTGNDD